MKQVLLYSLFCIFVFASCKTKEKKDSAFESIDLSISVGWTGENGSIKIDNLGNVWVMAQSVKDINKTEVHYFDYTIDSESLDSIVSQIEKVEFSKIDTRDQNEDCNRCLAYNIVVREQQGIRKEASVHVEYGREYDEDLKMLNELVLHICRRRITDPLLKRKEPSFESSLKRAYPAPLYPDSLQ